MKLNRKLVLILSLVLSLALATGGTLAYLSDTDADVNTMTLGNVYIVQNEQERDADGKLESYENDEALYPAVYPGTSIDWAPEAKWPGEGGQAWKVVADNELVVDKFVTVTNTGKSDAYIRTLIAYEGDATYGPEGKYIHIVHNAENVAPAITMALEGTVVIDDVTYTVYSYTYTAAVKPGETTIPSLKQVYMDKEADNEVVATYGEEYKIIALSQAVQTAGFADAKTALNTAFPMTDMAKWFGEAEKNIGSPSDKPLPDGNIDNNPPVFKPTTEWGADADTAWFDKNASEYTIDTAAELAGFAKLVNEGGEKFFGKTITLGADIDMAEHLWTPIGQTGATQFQGTFDGGDYTISNLFIDSSAKTGAHYSSGLFGWLNKATVKNVNVKNANVTGNHNVGVIAGYMETAGCTISNCNVTNATVIGKHANNDACGDKVGVIVGHAGNAGVKVENCSATNCKVVAGRDAGQIAGAAKPANVTDCTATDVTVTAGGDCTGANIKEEIIGRQL